MHTKEEKMQAFGRFLDVLDALRANCPWDKKQTNESLRPNTIEETYELCDALIKNDIPDICKELGDVLLHICFYAKIAEEQAQFDMADVCNALTRKMITRHPHVYHPSQIDAEDPKPLPYVPEEVRNGEVKSESTKVTTVGQVLENWEQIKLKEKDGNQSVLSGVPEALPSLIKAYRIQDKARNVGFDWEDRQDVWSKVREELDELETELNKDDKERSTAELGDFLFAVINAARLYKLNPDNALEKTNRKFIDRFNYIEAHSIKMGKPLKDMTLAEMDQSVFLGVFVAGVVLFGSCGGNKQQQYVEEDDNSTSMEDKEVTDRTIYGICTAGTAMNTLEMITDSGDTLKLNISGANSLGKVFGGLQCRSRHPHQGRWYRREYRPECNRLSYLEDLQWRVGDQSGTRGWWRRTGG